MIKALWDYRYFIFSSIRTEFRTRFSRSGLGGLWMLLHPLAQVVIYAFVLASVMSAKLPGITNRYAYTIYLMAGTMAWALFSEVLNRCSNVFIDNGNLMKKMSFPRIALPLIVVGSALVSNVLLMLAIVVVFSLLSHSPTASFFFLPLLVVLTLGLATGFGLAVGIVNVFVRDVGQLLSIALQFWFWLTPVVYPVTIIPARYRELLLWNPLTGIVMGYQEILVYGRVPDPMLLLYPSLAALVALCLALFLYRRAGEEMVDAL